MKRLLLFLALLGLTPVASFAQSTAQPAVIGYISTSSCPYGQVSCFVQYGATVPTSGGGGGGGAITGPLGIQTLANSVAVTSADCNLVTVGCEADTAWASGSGTLIAISKAIANAAEAPLTTQASTVSIGGVGLLSGTANVGNLNPSTPCATTVLAASLVCYNAAAVLHSFTVTADSTLDASVWYLMVFNATSLPADGAVTPLKCYQIPAGTAQFGGTFDAGGATFSTGVTFGVSTTGCFTKTASTHALFIGGE